MALKRIEWENPNKMKIDTGHKTFDAQTDLISDGNIIAGTMVGFYVRPYEETKCYGDPHPKGHLREFDLDGFKTRMGKQLIPNHVLRFIRTVSMIRGVAVYVFFHWYESSWGGTRRMIHGVIVTTNDYEDPLLLKKFVTGPTHKSWQIMDAVRPYVARLPEEMGLEPYPGYIG